MRRLRTNARLVRWLAYASIVTGGALIVAGVWYLVYARTVRSGLGSLEYSVPVERRTEWGLGPLPPTGRAGEQTAAGEEEETPSATAPVATSAAIAFPAAAVVAPYPAGLVNPKYWADPMWAGADPYGGYGLPEGFLEVNPREAGLAPAAGRPPTAMGIRAIDLEAAVIELAILDLGDSRAYETPNNVVGHIPGTANPGEVGRGWYFGHLESLVRGEGSVFRNLTRIPDLVKEDPVDVIVRSDGGEYLYRVTATRVVHEDELVLGGSSYASITLVACVPARVYDHRLLVEAELIAVRQ